MMSKRFNFTIGRKIYAIIALSFFGFLGVTLFEMRELRHALESQKTIELKHLTEIALGIAREEHAGAQKGTISDAEARKRAAARISAMRYGRDDYFWINDMHPRMVMHPMRPELNGTDLTDNKDPNGKRLFMEFVDTVKRQSAGVVAYDWPKPGATTPQPKMSYVAGFAPWNWVVGTGVYIDDLEQQTWNAARQALIIAGIVMLLIGIISVIVARGTSKAMRGMTTAMSALGAGDFNVVLPGLGRRDEIGDMAAAVEAFKLKAIERARDEAEQQEGGDSPFFFLLLVQRVAQVQRLRLFFALWIEWLEDSGLSGGCPILAAAIEFDDVPGPVHDAAATHFGDLHESLRRLAHAARPDGDAEMIAASVSGLAMSHLVRLRLLGRDDARAVTMRAFDALVGAEAAA